MAEATVARLFRVLRLATLLITLVFLFALDLPLLLANADAYHSFAAEVTAFAVLVLVTGFAGVRLWGDRPLRWWRWPALAAVFGASAAAVFAVPTEYVGTATEWSNGTIGWLCLLLLADRSLVSVLAALAAHQVFSFGQLVLTGGGDRATLVDLAMITVLVLGCQLTVAAATAAVRRMAQEAAATAAQEDRVRTAEAVAEQLHRDRRLRLANLTTTTVPLLAGLAAGAPVADRVAYAVEAARMRRLFAENDDVEDPLLHELRACADVAERKGVRVFLGTWGERPELPVAIRRALTEPVMACLATTVGEARVTLLGAAGSVTVSVVTDAPPPESVRAPAEVTVTRRESGGRYWVEAHYRPPAESRDH
ncbi:hypothetical protein [Amycolatopsis sp. 195334CR]|uniref:hypothetical protein n=1 Tax=Amycolatopsis sp. 195334CR TaxID=2814588 RepID=UPI001A8F2325|nr:hypothetical protein [Amycolatopsis sp. 195334CR]MBN6040306.1 hypothetical protein [Amycolatopsis sp. 195334CR]